MFIKNILFNLIKYKLFIIIFLSLFILSFDFIILNNNSICLCTVGKRENLYIREFVEYYIQFGVDKIFLYDNNELNGEKFEDVIGDYINNKSVEIVNYRGERGNLIKIMDDCYQKNHNRCEAIQLNWVHRSDNNKIFYENLPVQKRFTERGKNVVKNKINPLCFVKTIIRGYLTNKKITDNHYLTHNLKGCNGFGKKSKLFDIINKQPDYETYYINHYFSKSTEEFVNKINRGDILRGDNIKINNWQIKKYFTINKLTNEKLNYFDKHLGSKVNLSIYYEQLKKD